MGVAGKRTSRGWLVVNVLMTVALVTAATKAPPQTKAPAKATYVGDGKCAACHADIANAHAAGPHGALAATLPDGLKGCEACHGPGSLHAAGDNTAIVGLRKASPRDVDALCMKCHGADGAATAAPKSRKLQERSWMRGKHLRIGVSCTSCHSEHHGGAKLLKQDPGTLCVSCHASVKARPGEFAHMPTENGNCLLCHDAHSSSRPFLVRPTADRVCEVCHKTAKPEFATSHSGFDMAGARCTTCHSAHIKNKATHGLPVTQHKPFADRKCQLCHAAPAPGAKPTLTRPVAELCGQCHPATVSALAAPGSGHLHPPAQQRLCTACHDPHGTWASGAPLFRASVAMTCLTCHRTVDAARMRRAKHAPVEAGNCLTCHFGHKAPERQLLRKPDLDLCRGCHPNTHRGRHPIGYTEVGSKKRMVIDPRSGKMLTCLSCHEVHGGEQDYMVTATADRELCIQCHKPSE